MRTSILTIVALSSLTACRGSDGSDANAKCEACEGEAESAAILALVNNPNVDFDELNDDAELRSDAAANIIEHRDGVDREPGSDDDNLFDGLAVNEEQDGWESGLAELISVPQVGPTALEALLEYAIEQGYLQAPDGDADISVVFSPQSYDDSHLAKVAELIGAATTSIDIAMYSYSDNTIQDALKAATERGVDVRFLFETAYEDRKAEDYGSTKSGSLEEIGVDVRYVNKIMHHKYAIIDGPRDDANAAATAQIISGSGNWSYSAATDYDENTMFIKGVPEVTLRLQKEFNYLWEHSRDFNHQETDFVHSTLQIDEGNVQDVDDADVIFTSDNFSVDGDTFRKGTDNTVSDRLVEAIWDADTSIHVASGHLRSRPISEAIMAKRTASPDVEIKVYLDGQEYISDSTHAAQVEKLELCLEEATSESQERNCLDKGFYFGYQLHLEDVDVRYKYYAYRWDYTYAPQMHNKYMIIDGDELWAGSYNLSDNAEHNTFENMIQFKGERFSDVVASYEASFATLWETGEADSLYLSLIAEVEDGETVPLVFDAMALDWQQVKDLKSAIYRNCPTAYEEEWYTSDNDYSCTR